MLRNTARWQLGAQFTLQRQQQVAAHLTSRSIQSTRHLKSPPSPVSFSPPRRVRSNCSPPHGPSTWGGAPLAPSSVLQPPTNNRLGGWPVATLHAAASILSHPRSPEEIAAHTSRKSSRQRVPRLHSSPEVTAARSSGKPSRQQYIDSDEVKEATRQYVERVKATGKAYKPKMPSSSPRWQRIATERAMADGKRALAEATPAVMMEQQHGNQQRSQAGAAAGTAAGATSAPQKKKPSTSSASWSSMSISAPAAFSTPKELRRAKHRYLSLPEVKAAVERYIFDSVKDGR